MAEGPGVDDIGVDVAEELSEESLEPEGVVLEEWELAVKGVNLLVNNKWPEAEKLFQTYR